MISVLKRFQMSLGTSLMELGGDATNPDRKINNGMWNV